MNAQNLKEALSILGWSSSGNFDARNVLVQCPFAFKTHKKGTDKEPSMAIAPKDEGSSPAICNSCGEKGSFLSVVKRAADYGLVTQEAFCRVASLEIGSGLTTRTSAQVSAHAVKKKTKTWKDALSWIKWGRVSQTILDRGFKRTTCRAFELGYDPLLDRTVFPVYDQRKALVGLLSRRPEKAARIRYPTYPGWDPSGYLFGEHLVAGRQTRRPLVVVEGPLDACWVWQETDCPVVALMGLHLSDARVDKLRRLTDYLEVPLLLFLDNDEAGRRATDRFRAKLFGKIRRGAWTVKYPRSGPVAALKDPPEMTPAILYQLIEAKQLVC